MPVAKLKALLTATATKAAKLKAAPAQPLVLLPQPPYKTWREAGAAFLEIEVSTDGAAGRDNRNYLTLKGNKIGSKDVNGALYQDHVTGDGSIKSLMITIGKWISKGTEYENIGKMLNQSFGRMLQLEVGNSIRDPPIKITPSQIDALLIDQERRIIEVLAGDDWEELGYTQIIKKVLGENAAGVKHMRDKDVKKAQEAAKERQKSNIHMRTIDTLNRLNTKLAKERATLNPTNPKNQQKIKTLEQSINETTASIKARYAAIESNQVLIDHGHGFTVNSVRDTILAPVANTAQCEAVIGEYNDNDICYLCGLAFDTGCGASEKVPVDCEHVLGVLLAGMLINLVQGGIRIFNKEDENYKEILKLEYLWAHHCCNIIKSDEPFIKKHGFTYVVYEQKIDEMINTIVESSVDPTDKLKCRKLQMAKKDDLDKKIRENKPNIIKHMQAVCDFINGQIDGIKAMIPSEKGKDPDLMASQVFEAFIKFRFFGRIQGSLIVDGLVNAATICNYKTGLQTVVWPADITAPPLATPPKTGGGRYTKKQHGGENEDKDDLFDTSLSMFLNIFTEEEFLFIRLISKNICDMDKADSEKHILIIKLFLYVLGNPQDNQLIIEGRRDLNAFILHIDNIPIQRIIHDLDSGNIRSRKMFCIDASYEQMVAVMLDVINPEKNKEIQAISNDMHRQQNNNATEMVLHTQLQDFINTLFISIYKTIIKDFLLRTRLSNNQRERNIPEARLVARAYQFTTLKLSELLQQNNIKKIQELITVAREQCIDKNKDADDIAKQIKLEIAKAGPEPEKTSNIKLIKDLSQLNRIYIIEKNKQQRAEDNAENAEQAEENAREKAEENARERAEQVAELAAMLKRASAQRESGRAHGQNTVNGSLNVSLFEQQPEAAANNNENLTEEEIQFNNLHNSSRLAEASTRPPIPSRMTQLIKKSRRGFQGVTLEEAADAARVQAQLARDRAEGAARVANRAAAQMAASPLSPQFANVVASTKLQAEQAYRLQQQAEAHARQAQYAFDAYELSRIQEDASTRNSSNRNSSNRSESN
jgi:hypothetical protein